MKAALLKNGQVVEDIETFDYVYDQNMPVKVNALVPKRAKELFDLWSYGRIKRALRVGSLTIITEEKKMKKAKHSGKDSNGKEYTDCSECDRGGNGKHPEKCATGWKIKKGKQGMCFMGDLIDGLEI